jgi:hypothetical protein
LHTFKKHEHILVVSLIALLVFVALFLVRSIDDNRLTSWRWVFESVDAGRIYLAILGGLGLAYWLSRLALPGPKVLFVLAFAVAALFWRVPEVIVDSSRYFTQAKHLEVYGIGYFLKEWGGEVAAWTDMPLMPFVYGLIFKTLGESRIYVQVLNTSLFSFTAVLAFLLARDLWDEETGSVAGLLLLGMPYLLTQVPLVLVDVPSMFLLTLSVFAFNRALERGGALITALSVLAVSLAALCKYSLWMMLSVLPVILFVRLAASGGERSRIAGRGVLILALSGALAGCALLYKYGVVSEQIRFLMEYQRPGLRRWAEGFPSTFLFQIHPFVTAGALFSAYVAVKKRDLRYVIAAWLLALVLLLQIKRIRYVLPVFPMLSIIAAYGICSIRDVRVKRFIVLAAVFSSISLAVFGYLPFLERFSTRNLRDAGEYLDSLKADSVVVYTLPQKSSVNPAVSVPLLDMFSGKEIVYDYGMSGLSPPEEYLKSSLRFTWHYRNPEYYMRTGERPDKAVVVVISGSERFSLSSRIKREIGDCSIMKVFGATERIFRFRTVVTVCEAGH